MNEKFKELYSYFKSEGLTDLDENTFYKKYSNRDKANEVYSYLKQNGMTDLDNESFYSSYFGSKKKEPTVLPSEPQKERSSSATALPTRKDQITSPSVSSAIPEVTAPLSELSNKIEEGIYKYSGRKDALYKFSGGKWYVNPTGKGKYVELDDPDGRRSAVLNKQAVKVGERPAAEKIKRL